ncbi:MAG: adenylyl-sulfate kinase [Spirosomataceae bacterium]
MAIFQMTGLSGAGKSTIASKVAEKLVQIGYKVEVLDGDETRKTICKGLGFSKEDRIENISRLGFVANLLSRNGVVVIVAAINPYHEARTELKEKYNAKLIYVSCQLEKLIERDTKGLYKRALLKNDDPNKVYNLTGVSDSFDVPDSPDLAIETTTEQVEESVGKLLEFILNNTTK